MATRTFRKTQNLPVVSLAEGAILGRLDDFQFDLETGRIFGYRVRGQGVWARIGGVPAALLTRYGRDVVFVTDESALRWGTLSRGAEPGRAWATLYRGVAVRTRRGQAVGTVQDFLIEAEPAAVRALVLDRHRLLPFDEGVALGRDSVVVPDTAPLLDAGDEEEITETWARSPRPDGSGPD